MKWMTREQPKIDQRACPWLIARFIDKDAEFLYVPTEKAMPEAKKTGATSVFGPLVPIEGSLRLFHGARVILRCAQEDMWL